MKFSSLKMSFILRYTHRDRWTHSIYSYHYTSEGDKASCGNIEKIELWGKPQIEARREKSFSDLSEEVVCGCFLCALRTAVIFIILFYGKMMAL